MRLNDIVKFRGDRLFNGAVNIGWFDSDEERKRAASEAFVFHGPTYHGVSQDDVGVAHGHRLQDTANFARSIIKRSYGIEDQPFTLAIAGYGTGKSHLGLTLATLLSNPREDIAEAVLKDISRADATIGSDIQAILSESDQPCLVVALNGMQSFDLTTEVTRQVILQVKKAGLDTRPLDDLRPRFAQAASLIKMAESNTEVVDALLQSCQVDIIDDILVKLDGQDESTYSRVHEVLSARNIQITALGGESIRDVIDVACREYCGDDKFFRCLTIIFDEFGRFTEFATVRSHIAGSGVLQDLFEGIQSNSSRATFSGFIQFDLNAYVQRVAPEHRNEILRYVTRYQSADRVYLSINLETLIASLIDKEKPEELTLRFENEESKQESTDILSNIHSWFPQSKNHSLWNDSEQFHSVVRMGCWPLSTYSTWFLFHLAAAGKHLQERSALALLADVFERSKNHELVDGDKEWVIAPVDFWSESLQNELILSEEGGQQGSITHAYATVHSRHGTQISEDLIRLLRAVVLASKMGLKVNNQEESIEALAEIAGLHLGLADKGIKQLKDDYNVLDWDESFKEFDILGDGVPRTQFLSFVRQRVASAYDDDGKAKLFASKASGWCDILGDLDCDFAEENSITTREWRYASVTSSFDVLPMQIKLASDRWSKALKVDEPRGTIIYCYIEPTREEEAASKDAIKLLRAASKEANVSALPILIVLLCDSEGSLGQSLAELTVLEDSLSEEDRLKFGNLIPAHQEKTRSVIRSGVESMLKQRLYLTACKDPLEAKRLSRVGAELFTRIYKSIIPFPFDGFSTAKGNAADSCQELTSELLLGNLDWNSVISKPIKLKNRASSVLKDEWGIFANNGSVRTRPICPTIRSLTEKWDEMLSSGEQRISIQNALRQLCAPPYGANIASAGLYLGVFVAARGEKLSFIRGERQYSVAELLEGKLFRSKFIDLGATHDLELIRIADESSEWEVMLEEWELAENHLTRRANLERALKLEKRLPVPPSQGYRYTHLKDLSKESISALERADKKESEAITKIESGLERQNVNLLVWGAGTLVDLTSQMHREGLLWTENQIQDIQPYIDRVRQAVIQFFPNWLGNQRPHNETPDEVGSFKHKMLKLTGGHLKKLSLDDLYERLETRVKEIVKNVEVVAEAHQVIREVNLWITSHADATRFPRVAQLRSLHAVGSEHRNKLTGLSQRIEMPELSDVRAKLTEALSEMKKVEKGLFKRAEKLWNSKIKSIEEIEKITAEVDALVGAFEGCEEDLEDLQIMRRALRLYRRDYQQLNDEHLTWSELENQEKSLRAEADDALGEEELPWTTDEALDAIIETITKTRKASSQIWIGEYESEAAELESISVADANMLHDKGSAPPPFLTEPHTKRLQTAKGRVEKRLEDLQVEWLVERFSKLPQKLQKEFLKIAKERLD